MGPYSKELAKKLLRQYAKNNATFTAFEAFEYCFRNGLSEPTHINSLSSLFRSTLIATNMVQQIGTQKSTVPSAKGRLVVLYKSVVYAHGSGELDEDRQYLANLKHQVHMRKIDVGQAISLAYAYGKTGKR